MSVVVTSHSTTLESGGRCACSELSGYAIVPASVFDCEIEQIRVGLIIIFHRNS